MQRKPFIFCALDSADLSHTIQLAKIIAPVTGGLKLGLEFFNAFGPDGVEKIQAAAPEAALFIDLKFHDIPNTVAAAVKTISNRICPAYLNVHAGGGLAMMRAAKESCHENTKLLAVTVLTSLSQTDLHSMNVTQNLTDHVKTLGLLARQAGLDGIVCSAHEIAALREALGPDFILMVPGIRPEGSNAGDQQRIMTPQQARQAGATHLVIGRPITGAPDPARAAKDIVKTL